MDLLKALTIGAMFGIGVFQMLRRNVIRSTIGLIIIANAVNLFLLATGAYQGAVAAYVTAPASAATRSRRRWCSPPS